MRLPVLSSEGNLSIYLQEIKKFPILTAEEEYMLAKRYKEHGDTEAAHKPKRNQFPRGSVRICADC